MICNFLLQKEVHSSSSSVAEIVAVVVGAPSIPNVIQ